MSLFVKLEDPVKLKKALLITKMAALNNMKRYEECKQFKKEIKEKAASINEIFINVPPLVEEIKRMLPEVDIKKLTFEKGMLKCEICGKRFKTEQGLKIHQANVHGIKKGTGGEGKSQTEVDRLTKELEDIERELKDL